MDPSPRSQVPAESIPAQHQTFAYMSINELRTFKKYMAIFRSLETISNRPDGELSVGIPLVPNCRRTDGHVLADVDLRG